VTIVTLQRLWSVGVPLAGALIAWWWLPEPIDPWLLAAAAVLAPVAVVAGLLAIEFTVAAAVDPRSPRQPAFLVLGMWLQEVSVSLRLFMWRQPWRSGFPEPPLAREPQRPALLLIAGFMCNRAAWRPLLDSGLLRDFNVATVNLEPIFGDIDAYAEVVHRAVQKLRAATGAARVMLVGHSMGGLASRVYLRRHGDAHVARIVTLASPHLGTVFGKLGHSRNARQMARGSRFIEKAATDDRGRWSRFTTVATRDDNLVVPRSSPLLPGARQIEIDGVGHLALLEDRRAWQIVVDEARRAFAASPQRSAIQALA
jgi:predicted alpha/beta hydrolase family esterase